MSCSEGEPEDDFNNALHTLAYAAIKRASIPVPKTESKTLLVTVASCSNPETWYDVGIIKGNSCVVNDFYLSDDIDHSNLTSENLPNYINFSKVELQPGTAYKFRVAAINSFGRGEWSDLSAFKTCLSGFPSAPCLIRVSRSDDGVRIQWDPPTMTFGKIIEYSLCLAVKVDKANSPTVSQNNLQFFRVYCGIDNHAFVDNDSLNAAYVDTDEKPAITFRIAARNEKGYGPATQVRWLQNVSHTKDLAKNK